jgi:hypothetical protein
MSLTVVFGKPAEDAHLLVCGFGRPDRHNQVPARPLAQRFRFILPIPADRTNGLTLRLAAPVKHSVRLFLDGTLMGEQPLPGDGEWRDLSFNLPAEAIKKNGPTAEFVLSARHPLNSFAPRCAMAGAFTVTEAIALPLPEALQSDVFSAEPFNAYFGDVHVHSHHSHDARDSGGSITAICTLAKEQSQFIALADHDGYLSDERWRDMKAELLRCEEPGRFAVLFGYEWTSFFYGQINVYSSSPELPLFRSTDVEYDSPPKLWRALESWGGPFFCAYHHTTRPGMSVAWELCDDKYMPVMEICSGWGDSEAYGTALQKPGMFVPGTSAQDALARGLTLGFVGGGDIHDLTRPGTRGITGVAAGELTREAVFEAIRDRRCWATSNAHIKLDFKVNGRRMGRITRFNPYLQDVLYPLEITFEVEGTAPLASVEVATNSGVILYSRTGAEMGHASKFSDQLKLPNIARGAPGGATLSCSGRWFYLRVIQAPQNEKNSAESRGPYRIRETAWSSPVFLLPDWRDWL